MLLAFNQICFQFLVKSCDNFSERKTPSLLELSLLQLKCCTIYLTKSVTTPFGFECPFTPSPFFHTLRKCRFQRAELNVSARVKPQHFSKCHLAIGKNEQWMSSWRSTTQRLLLHYSHPHPGGGTSLKRVRFLWKILKIQPLWYFIISGLFSKFSSEANEYFR